MKKTWKIGEYAKGGVIETIVEANKVIVIGKEWDMSTGTRKSSSQKNAKEFTRIEVLKTDRDLYRKLDNFIIDLTTSYYTGKLMDWVKDATISELNNW